jgi:hypothetical protein
VASGGGVALKLPDSSLVYHYPMSQKFNRNQHVFRSEDFIKVVGEAVNFLVRSPVHPLPPLTRFEQAGVYLLYYVGDFEPYAVITTANQKRYIQPIYVGKAVPAGWRRGRNADTAASSLYGRLKEHSRSIASVKNLKLKDFVCRFMILEGQESNIISTVESELIRQFKPLWNSVIDGFGNHDPGSGRYNQSPSEWDILHPGRSWAKRLTGEAPVRKKILEKIRQSTL